MYTPLRFLCIATLVLLSTIGLVSIHAAQQTPAVQGDFIGTLGPLDIKLHITSEAIDAKAYAESLKPKA